jgi:hypothetical protein
MAAPVTVFGPVISPAVARVAACLLEKDVPFQIQPVDMSKGEHKSPSFLKLQPFGQVPAFKDHLATVFGTPSPEVYVLIYGTISTFPQLAFLSLRQVPFINEGVERIACICIVSAAC